MKHSCSDWIHLTEASFPCIVGLLDWERSTPQPLVVEISLNVDLDGAADGNLARSVNYATTLLQVEFIAREGEWQLLESLGAALARLLLAPPASGERRTEVSEVVVRLRKPTVLSGRAIPCVELRRPSSWLTLSKLVNGVPGVAVEVLQEARGTGAYRIHVDRGSEWTIPDNMACMLIAGAGITKSSAPTIGDVLRGGAGTFLASAPVCFIGVSRVPRPDSTTEGDGNARHFSHELPNKKLQQTSTLPPKRRPARNSVRGAHGNPAHVQENRRYWDAMCRPEHRRECHQHYGHEAQRFAGQHAVGSAESLPSRLLPYAKI